MPFINLNNNSNESTSLQTEQHNKENDAKGKTFQLALHDSDDDGS